MAAPGSSMLYSFLLFVATLSLQEMYRVKLASSELFTILGGFTSSLIFLMLLTFVGNYQETCGIRTGWGAGNMVSACVYDTASLAVDPFKNNLSFNFQSPITESCNLNTFIFHDVKVIFAEAVALIAASTVHRVCITTCFLFSAGLLYEINQLSGMMLSKSESKSKRY